MKKIIICLGITVGICLIAKSAWAFTRIEFCGSGTFEPQVEECDKSETLITIKNQCNDPIGQTVYKNYGDDVQCIGCKCVGCGDGRADTNMGEECDVGSPLVDIVQQCEDFYGQIPGVENAICDEDKCICRFCGNGRIDPPDEQCDWTGPSHVGACICDPRTCKCTRCGDGVFDPQTEECSNSTSDPTTDPSTWTDMDVDSITGEKFPVECPHGEECTYCECNEKEEAECGNGILEAGEECEVDIACEDADATCTINCKCEKEPPPECPPQECPTPVLGKAACSISIDGYSSPGHQKIIEGWNDRFHDLIEGNPKIDPETDFVAEAGFSTVQIMLRAKDTVAQDVAKFAGGKAQTTNGVSYGRWAWIALSGTPPIDFKTRKFKPPTKVYIDKPTRIFPLSSTDIAQAGATKEMAGVPKGLKAIELPDLSAGLSGLNLDLTTPVEIDNVAMALGGDDLNIQVSEDLDWRLNNVVSLKLQPGMSLNKATATEGVGDMVVLWRAIVEPDRASWTGPEGRPVLMPGEEWKDLYIENRKLSIQAAMDHVEQNIQACYPDCDCSAFLGSDYEENLHYQYAFVQDTVTPEQTGLGKSAGTGTNTTALGVAHIAMIGGVGRGGGGCQCSVNSVVPSASHLILMIGMAASGLAGIIAVRRRKR